MKSLDLIHLRPIFFFGGLVFFFTLAQIFPYRKVFEHKAFRWINNLSLTFLNATVVSLVLPFGLFTLAQKASTMKLGLFNYVNLPSFIEYILSLFLLDLIIYFQHRWSHSIPLFWKLHRVHHTDIAFDTSTALRFHPLEILISLGIKALSVFVFGVSPLAILSFEIILNFSAMFNHSNFQLPSILERWTRSIFVTPDFHRVHHSIQERETNSNFGFCLSIWDRIFKTYIATTKEDPAKMNIGLSSFRKIKDQRLDQLLTQPFRKSGKH